jgi:hypothetical protein
MVLAQISSCFACNGMQPFHSCRLPLAVALVWAKDTTEQGFEPREKSGRAVEHAGVGLSSSALEIRNGLVWR